MQAIVLIFFALAGSIAKADVYQCKSRLGAVGILTIEGKFIEWSEPWRAALSDGISIGIETDVDHQWWGFARFRLTDFYSNQTSSYILAAPLERLGLFTIFVYFDNDSRPEEIISYTCTASNS